MKLSEALMLGSMSSEKPHNGATWDSCLLGVACHAIGERGVLEESVIRWPWLGQEVHTRHLLGGMTMGGQYVLTAFCHKVETGEWSIQQAAEAVAEMEPQDIQDEQMDGGQVTHPTELSRSDEVQNIGV